MSVAAALSGACCFCAVCAGVAAAISSRARAMVSVLAPLASSPQCLIRQGNLQGILPNPSLRRRFLRLKCEPVQRLAAKFPMQRNREFLEP